MVSKFNLKLVSESDFRSSNRTGREFVFAGDGSTTRMQIFFVDRRVFVLAYLSKGQKKKMRKSKDKRHNRAAQKFFDSFEVTGIPVT